MRTCILILTLSASLLGAAPAAAQTPYIDQTPPCEPGIPCFRRAVFLPGGTEAPPSIVQRNCVEQTVQDTVSQPGGGTRQEQFSRQQCTEQR